jgi:hypothetical protein
LRNTVGYNRPVSAPVSHSGVVKALAAAALFGASTPLAKLLVGAVPPVLLAGLLYLGSGIGLLAWFLWRRLRADHPAREAALTRRDLPWLAGAILSGGVLGPALLMFGLAHTPAASASLLLNLEGVFTAGLLSLFTASFPWRESFAIRRDEIYFSQFLVTTGEDNLNLMTQSSNLPLPHSCLWITWR